jgi:hypothetical protein
MNAEMVSDVGRVAPIYAVTVSDKPDSGLDVNTTRATAGRTRVQWEKLPCH